MTRTLMGGLRLSLGTGHDRGPDLARAVPPPGRPPPAGTGRGEVPAVAAGSGWTVADHADATSSSYPRRGKRRTGSARAP
ncbi:hypothetical protein ACLQ2R_29520 [Streptosporangium sp. DT93]|uniref:hypothetical protein n=1 Tax=Streptosporangium sp. DT93 TaxID=3393428 RepID=UPI003CEEEDEA